MQKLVLVLVVVIAFLFFENKTKEIITANFKEYERSQFAYIELLRSDIKGIIEDKRALLMEQAFRGTDCANCHYKNNYPLPKSKLKFNFFECYVRGSCRWNMDKSMPVYGKDKISDEELRTLYNAIYE